MPCSELPRLAVIERDLAESEKRYEQLDDTLRNLNKTLQDFRIDMAKMQTRYQVIVGAVGTIATGAGMVAHKLF